MHRFFLLLTIAMVFLTVATLEKNKNNPVKTLPHHTFTSTNNNEVIRLKKYADEIKSFAQRNHFNSSYCFLADMKLPSGSNRFFVYDLKNDSVVNAGLVTHGSGITNMDEIIFSNKAGSNCTSLGRYKIGTSYNGKFGLAYKLYGLDSSNSNAYNRFVVLHAHACVPESEVLPQQICKSWGCPTVSPAFLIKLNPYITKAEKPIVLQIFY